MADLRVLSACGSALLAAVVEAHAAGEAMSFDQLYRAIPAASGAAAGIALWAEWPRDTNEWVDELQTLLDRDLVVRVATDTNYRFVPTREGVLVFAAAVHPQRRLSVRRNVA